MFDRIWKKIKYTNDLTSLLRFYGHINQRLFWVLILVIGKASVFLINTEVLDVQCWWPDTLHSLLMHGTSYIAILSYLHGIILCCIGIPYIIYTNLWLLRFHLYGISSFIGFCSIFLFCCNWFCDVLMFF